MLPATDMGEQIKTAEVTSPGITVLQKSHVDLSAKRD